MTENPIVDSNEAMLQIGKDIWWLLLIRGIFAVLFGIVALVWPGVTVWAMVVVFGVYAIVDGLVEVVRSIQARKIVTGWVWWLIGGIVSVAAGVVAFAWPEVTVLVAVYVIGFWAILVGILEIMGSFKVKSVGGQWVWLLVAGILAVLFGLLLVIFPVEGVSSLVWLVGFFAIIFGIVFVAGAFQLRSAAKRAGVV
ncbi:MULTISPECIES: HdeD family acid-resistance protein [Rhodococcus]|uniref:Uncharacterized membrane protein HdeD, DUF308 family n=1 Tax=Rhodococcus maanshanensis TaxID=183556 RepID=A0A1H7TC05_9NOCA|nr:MULTISPECIES: HdeD family acid-resistance protein [Rhodococcus]SEL82321.1 Uncharacterized membrane protein HdeD, DUF308 family [Rhodococcus maanshanensis]